MSHTYLPVFCEELVSPTGGSGISLMVGNDVVDECGEDSCCPLIVTVSLVEDNVVGKLVVLACNNTSIQSRNSDSTAMYICMYVCTH